MRQGDTTRETPGDRKTHWEKPQTIGLDRVSRRHGDQGMRPGVIREEQMGWRGRELGGGMGVMCTPKSRTTSRSGESEDPRQWKFRDLWGQGEHPGDTHQPLPLPDVLYLAYRPCMPTLTVTFTYDTHIHTHIHTF